MNVGQPESVSVPRHKMNLNPITHLRSVLVVPEVIEDIGFLITPFLGLSRSLQRFTSSFTPFAESYLGAHVSLRCTPIAFYPLYWSDIPLLVPR